MCTQIKLCKLIPHNHYICIADSLVWWSWPTWISLNSIEVGQGQPMVHCFESKRHSSKMADFMWYYELGTKFIKSLWSNYQSSLCIGGHSEKQYFFIIFFILKHTLYTNNRETRHCAIFLLWNSISCHIKENMGMDLSKPRLTLRYELE